jgi:hypothetical protein
MIRVLVRHDPDLKLLRWLLPGAVAVGAWMGWVFRHWSSTLAHYENSGMTPPSAPLGMMLLGALSLGLYGILLATNSRKVSALGMVLPVTGRQLVLARAITLTIAFAAPVLLYTLRCRVELTVCAERVLHGARLHRCDRHRISC